MGADASGRKMEGLKQKLHVILASAATMIFFLTILPSLSLLLLMYKYLVELIAKIFRKDLAEMVWGLSNLLATDAIDKNPKVNMVGFITLDSSLSVETFRSAFQERVIDLKNPKTRKQYYPEYCQSLTNFMGYNFWKWDRDFDLKNHIREYDYQDSELTLPSPCQEDDLKRIMRVYLAKPWRKNRSPWEVLFINNFHDAGAKKDGLVTVILLSQHHSIGDGYSILSVIFKDLLGATPTALPKPNFSRNQFLSSLVAMMCVPYRLTSQLVLGTDGRNSWHLTDRKLSRKYNVAAKAEIGVDIVKQIRKKHNVSYSAVVCEALGGCVRKVMVDAGQEIPDSISCLLVVPLPNHPKRLANHAASIYVKLDLTMENRGRSLRRINEEMQNAKQPSTLYANLLFAKWVGICPRIINTMLVTKQPATIGLSCVPSLDNPPSFFGAHMKNMMVNMGLGAGKTGAFGVLNGYGKGKQNFSLVVDTTVLPSEKALVGAGDYFEEELNILLRTEPFSHDSPENLV